MLCTLNFKNIVLLCEKYNKDDEAFSGKISSSGLALSRYSRRVVVKLIYSQQNPWKKHINYSYSNSNVIGGSDIITVM